MNKKIGNVIFVINGSLNRIQLMMIPKLIWRIIEKIYIPICFSTWKKIWQNYYQQNLNLRLSNFQPLKDQSLKIICMTKFIDFHEAILTFIPNQKVNETLITRSLLLFCLEKVREKNNYIQKFSTKSSKLKKKYKHYYEHEIKTKVEDIELIGWQWRFLRCLTMKVFLFEGRVAKRTSYVK